MKRFLTVIFILSNLVLSAQIGGVQPSYIGGAEVDKVYLGTNLIYELTPSTLYGAELVTNGGFDTTSNWAKNASFCSIAGGVASVNGGGDPVLYQNSSTYITTGNFYKLEITVLNYVSGTLRCKVGFNGTNDFQFDITANGTYSVIKQGGDFSSQLRFDSGDNFQGDIDNISLKAVL